jgi:hypothetical protein
MNSQPTPSGSQTPKTAGIEPAHDDGLEFEPEPASSPPPTLAGGDKEPPAVWYVARPGRPQLGPITLVALKKQLVAGTLSPGDLVWKAGMPGWVRAETIPDLSAAPPGVPPPLARSGFDRNADLFRHLNGILAGAAFYRVIGRSCAALGFIIFLGSMLLSYWQWTWFTGAMLFLVIGLVGEAAGNVLEALHRIEAELKRPKKAEKDLPHNDSERAEDHAR